MDYETAQKLAKLQFPDDDNELRILGRYGRAMRLGIDKQDTEVRFPILQRTMNKLQPVVASLMGELKEVRITDPNAKGIYQTQNEFTQVVMLFNGEEDNIRDKGDKLQLAGFFNTYVFKSLSKGEASTPESKWDAIRVGQTPTHWSTFSLVDIHCGKDPGLELLGTLEQAEALRLLLLNQAQFDPRLGKEIPVTINGVAQPNFRQSAPRAFRQMRNFDRSSPVRGLNHT